MYILYFNIFKLHITAHLTELRFISNGFPVKYDSGLQALQVLQIINSQYVLVAVLQQLKSHSLESTAVHDLGLDFRK